MKNMNNNGSVILPLILILPFLMLTAGYYVSLSVNSLRIAQDDRARTLAQLASDSGADTAVQEINKNGTYGGTGTQITLQNDGIYTTTYQTTVTDVNTNTKTALSTGRTFRNNNLTTPISTVTTETKFRAVTSGEFSIVTGVGGLFMSNSARILGGDVFINGEVRLSNNAQIGLSNNPVKIDVAHQNCPDPPTAAYPQLCPGGSGQPIEISGSARIYGSIRANNQTNTNGMSNPGLTASSGVVPQALPNHDRAAQKAAITTTQTGLQAGCSSGVKTWPANLKIEGDVEVRGSCVVTVEGDVWITGSLTTSNSSRIRLSDAAGTTRANIMVDGSGVKLNNASMLASNSVNTGFQILTYRSAAACSPDCTSVTGTDLFNSRNITTIELDNSASGPNTIFYARWSRVLISNAGQIGALVGQTIELRNSSTITFGTSVGTGSKFWIIDGYRRVFQ